MAMIQFNDNPPDRMLRQFAGIWFPLFWVAVATFVYFNTGSLPMSATIVAIGVVLGAVGMFRVAFIRPIFLLWMAAAYPIGWVVSHVILGVIFYLVVTPIGFAMKAVGYDSLQRRIDKTAGSYWTPVQQATSKSAYFRQF